MTKLALIAFLGLGRLALADAPDLPRPVMEAVCEAHSNLVDVSVGETSRAACVGCPAYTGLPKDERLKIGSVYQGHFSSATAEEMILELENCEPEARGGGGTVLLRKNEKGWDRIAYHAGKRPLDCVSLTTTSGRDVLACHGTESNSDDRIFRTVNVWSVEGTVLSATELMKPLTGMGEGAVNKGTCVAVEIAEFKKRDPASLQMTVIASKQKVPEGQACPERGTEEKRFVLEAPVSDKGLKLSEQATKDLKELRKYLDGAKAKKAPRG